MHRYHRVVKLRINELQPWLEKFQPDYHGHGPAHKKHYQGEQIKFIDTEDIWKFAAIAAISAIIISPCQILSLKECDNPGKSKAIVNLNSIIAFFLAFYFIRGTKFEMKTVFGIILVAIGLYLII